MYEVVCFTMHYCQMKPLLFVCCAGYGRHPTGQSTFSLSPNIIIETQFWRRQGREVNSRTGKGQEGNITDLLWLNIWNQLPHVPSQRQRWTWKQGATLPVKWPLDYWHELSLHRASQTPFREDPIESTGPSLQLTRWFLLDWAHHLLKSHVYCFNLLS